MQVQLFIENQRVELFKDESINLNQTIQNVRNIGAVFTDFSQQFNIPASKINNKIFKHYYNFNLLNGFDARKKVDAIIKLNGVDFSIGKIKLNGVSMKNNKASSYKIVFYGNTITLTDLLGEDKLEDLDLSSFDDNFSFTDIKNKLALNPETNAFICPLISIKSQLYYDSATDVAGSFNLNYNGAVVQGVPFNDLRYALRIDEIIQAIETKYSITFSTDFFNSSNDAYYKLFMWLARKPNSIEEGNQETVITTLIDGWAITIGNPEAFMLTTSKMVLVDTLDDSGESLKLTTTTATTDLYSVFVYRDNVLVFSKTAISGTDSNFITDTEAGAYTVEISSTTTALLFSSIKWDVVATTATRTFDTGSYALSINLPFVVSKQIPEIKTIDFLTGLFKMFNLTAYVEKDIIVVKTLDSYYSSGVDRDITKYIDISKSSVNTALPYKEIVFKYEGNKTYLSDLHNKDFQVLWGGLEYDDSESELDGGIYTITIPFSHMKYQRLIDLSDSSLTTIQWGFSVNISKNSHTEQPLLFYPYLQSSGEAVSVVDPVGVVHSQMVSYVIPLNSEDINSTTSKVNINFNNEINEYDGSLAFTETLFENYYKTYIQDVFNIKNRITKVTAYLPMSILLNYSLADVFIISGKKYRINNISTKLQTGKSELELINIL